MEKSTVEGHRKGSGIVGNPTELGASWGWCAVCVWGGGGLLLWLCVFLLIIMLSKVRIGFEVNKQPFGIYSDDVNTLFPFVYRTCPLFDIHCTFIAYLLSLPLAGPLIFATRWASVSLAWWRNRSTNFECSSFKCSISCWWARPCKWRSNDCRTNKLDNYCKTAGVWNPD